jgi:hypothetical protein
VRFLLTGVSAWLSRLFSRRQIPASITRTRHIFPASSSKTSASMLSNAIQDASRCFGACSSHYFRRAVRRMSTCLKPILGLWRCRLLSLRAIEVVVLITDWKDDVFKGRAGSLLVPAACGCEIYVLLSEAPHVVKPAFFNMQIITYSPSRKLISPTGWNPAFR